MCCHVMLTCCYAICLRCLLFSLFDWARAVLRCGVSFVVFQFVCATICAAYVLGVCAFPCLIV